MNRRSLAVLLLSLSAAALAGCGGYTSHTPPPATVPVAGKVYLPGGAPLTGGRIVFKPKEAGRQEGIGEIDSDGSYKLTSFNKGDGAMPGDYTVVIEPVSYKTGSAVAVRANIPRKYQSSSSDIVVTVKDGQADYPIRMK